VFKSIPFASFAALVCAATSQAASITFVTPAGSTTSGGSVDALATLTTGAGTLSITLTDLEANPTDVAQTISDLDFMLSNGATTGTLSSSSGQEVTVNGNGTFTLGSTGSTGWGLNDNVSGGLQLDALGFIGPENLIIGPPDGTNHYSDGNGSIDGNGAHNPFLNRSATYVLAITGVSSSTTITSATFSFGTTAGSNVTGVVSTPEPTAISLVLFGAVAVCVFKRRRFR